VWLYYRSYTKASLAVVGPIGSDIYTGRDNGDGAQTEGLGGVAGASFMYTETEHIKCG